MNRPTLTPLARILTADAQLAAWNARQRREAALLAVVRRALPRPVAERVFVVAGDGPVLELATSSGAIATVVRQHGPDLVARLAREGWEFSGIRLRVQPRQAPPELPKPPPRQWDSTARHALAGLQASLPPGPLRAAVSKFLKGR
jgi:hypothetical protein